MDCLKLEILEKNDSLKVTFRAKTTAFLGDLDYYPFGSILPGRSFNASEYKFGFQGQLKDDEIAEVTGAHLNYKFREYDSRIGRMWSIDPLTAKYPWNSPYAFSENRVIDGVELEGLEVFLINGYLGLGPNTPTQAEMEKYWNSKIDFQGIVSNYFNETDVRYKSGHRSSTNGTPNSLPSLRVNDGFTETLNSLKSGKLVLNNKIPITIVGHSQGNAYGIGVVLAIRTFENDFNKSIKAGEEKLNTSINFVMLAVFQSDSPLFSFLSKLNVNAIQFTYGNDLPDVGKVKGVSDANPNNLNYAIDGKKSSSLKAHSAVIDNSKAINKVIEKDSKEGIFIKK